jgi:hypothetical protein
MTCINSDGPKRLTPGMNPARQKTRTRAFRLYQPHDCPAGGKSVPPAYRLFAANSQTNVSLRKESKRFDLAGYAKYKCPGGAAGAIFISWRQPGANWRILHLLLKYGGKSQ